MVFIKSTPWSELLGVLYNSYDIDEATVSVGLMLYNSYIIVMYLNPKDSK